MLAKLRFSALDLDEPASRRPERLGRLARSVEGGEGPGGNPPGWKPVRYPPRSVGAILEDLENGRADDIDLLEWVYCLAGKGEWDGGSPERARPTSSLIWQASERCAGLLRILLWRLCLHHDLGGTDNGALAPSLAETFSAFAPRAKGKGSTALRIARALSEGDGAERLARIAYEKKATPTEVLADAGLPPGLRTAGDALDRVARFLAPRPENDQAVGWLLRCAERMGPRRLVDSANLLLSSVPAESATKFPELVAWMKNRFGPGSPGTLWDRLDKGAKKSLRKWIGGATYGDFKRLVEILRKDKTYLKDLIDWEKNQLRKRTQFWSNYSDRFERLRILLPDKTKTVLQKHIRLLNIGRVDRLEEDNSPSTEVCVFDFGEWVVVELFHGKGSEIRLFKGEKRLKKLFFEDPGLTIGKIRFLGGKRHDHQYLWQYFCEKMLREQGILPNEDTKVFASVPEKHARYDFADGLPPPSEDKLLERWSKLSRWEKEMDWLEKQSEGLAFLGKSGDLKGLAGILADDLAKNGFLEVDDRSTVERRLWEHLEGLARRYEGLESLSRSPGRSYQPPSPAEDIKRFVAGRLIHEPGVVDVYGDEPDILACVRGSLEKFVLG